MGKFGTFEIILLLSVGVIIIFALRYKPSALITTIIGVMLIVASQTIEFASDDGGRILKNIILGIGLALATLGGIGYAIAINKEKKP